MARGKDRMSHHDIPTQTADAPTVRGRRRRADHVNRAEPSDERAGANPVTMRGWRRLTNAFAETGEQEATPAPTTPHASEATPGQQGGAEPQLDPKLVIIAPGKRKPAHNPGQARARSRAARIVAITMICVTLFTALAIAAPLGSRGTGSNAFQAYANIMPWDAPTPTHTPTKPPVTSANPGRDAIIADIQSVFGSYAPGALNIARCESGYNPNAWNPTPVLNSHAEGVFQILYPATWNGTPYASYSPYNSWANIRAAYSIFKRDGYSWREWQCKPT